MTTPRIRTATGVRALLLSLATGLLVPAALAVSPTAAGGLPDAEARYRADRAACLEGPENRDREACMRDAGAALAEARAAKRRPSPPQAEPDYAANALARCERVPERDRADCRLRMQGHGTREGSVAEGAIMYELVTRAGVPAASAASAP
jgi:hypothetical protein